MSEATEHEIDPEDGALATLPPATSLPAAPVGRDAQAVQAWFDDAIDTVEPVMDGSLAAERESALMFQRMAKAENTRIAYRAAVRAWCAWCAHHGLPPPARLRRRCRRLPRRRTPAGPRAKHH